MGSFIDPQNHGVPLNSVLHCDAYPDVDVPMTDQQKMKYERNVVSLSRERIENQNSHAKDAMENIQEELRKEIHLTVPTDMLYSNLKHVRLDHHATFFLFYQITLRYESNNFLVRGKCSAFMDSPCPYTGSLLCHCTSCGFAPMCATCGHPAAQHRPLEPFWETLLSREFAGPREFPGALNHIEKDQKAKSLLVVGDNNCLPGMSFMKGLESKFMVQNLSIEYGILSLQADRG